MSKKIWLLIILLICFLVAYFESMGTQYNTSSDGQNLSIKTVCAVKSLSANDSCQVTAMTTVTAKKDTVFDWTCCQTPEAAQNITDGNNSWHWLGASCDHKPGAPARIATGQSVEFTSSFDLLLSSTNRFAVVDVQVIDGSETLTTHQKVNLALAA